MKKVVKAVVISVGVVAVILSILKIIKSIKKETEFPKFYAENDDEVIGI